MVIGFLAAGAYTFLMFFFRLCMMMFRHPIVAGIIFLCIFGVTSCMGHFNMGSLDARTAIHSTPMSIERELGSPNDCDRDYTNSGIVSCKYDNADVVFAGDDVRSITFHHLDHTEFTNTSEFYHHVLTMLNIAYRPPVSATIDQIIWQIPGVGKITATSNNRMNVDGVTIDPS